MVVPRCQERVDTQETTMESKDTKTPVIITDGKSNSKMFVSIVSAGLVIAVLFVIGTVIRSVSANLAPPKFSAAAGTNNDARMLEACNQLIKAGRLAEARGLLEKAQDASGLTPEMSSKLDEIYIDQARLAAARGATEEAVDVLKLIPSESSLYAKAQETIKSLTAPPKAAVKPKQHHTIHGKHHK